MAGTWWTKPEDLDEKQLEVVSLGLGGNHLILGPAGCGKTNLLLLRATYLHKSKISNIAVFAFGRVLKEFLTSGAANYPFSSDKIQTYLRWGAEMLSANGIAFSGKGNFDEVRAELYEKLYGLAGKNLEENRLDCILIDEAQDYDEREIDLIFSFADQIFAVGDDRQRISNVSGALERLAERCDHVIELTDHYRNGFKICRLADGIRNSIDSEDGLEAHSKYNESEFESTVRSFPNLDLKEQVQKAIDEISEQLDAYPGDLIGVLCPRQEELGEVWDLIANSPLADEAQLQQFAGGYAQFQPNRRIIVTTIHGAKGLEFRALHLLGMDFIKKFKTQKNMSYTAVTRCKTSLRIYHDSDLPGYLEKGLSCLDNSVATPPSVKDLFQ
ncbi:AAA family ATPase [Mesorhizobium sp. LMG17149]|uniref:AAA family ATPase n=1 Tax=Mesorhizobium sp. LMG17149 TaxID=2968497 RepID=UPI0021192DC8|nr:AAA family ATPase [Mesorhizobium sp. LMG17149]MCQ8873090.1 AAA family ATPase [Mesorhizobium sp. LMG17149]